MENGGSNYLVAYGLEEDNGGILEYKSIKEFTILDPARKFAQEHLAEQPLLVKTDLTIDERTPARNPSRPYVLIAKKSSSSGEGYGWGAGDSAIWYEVARHSPDTLEEAIGRLREESTIKSYIGLELRILP